MNWTSALLWFIKSEYYHMNTAWPLICYYIQTSQDVEQTNSDLIAVIPLALCETGIVYWVFSSLLQTIRTLRLRRNVAKLSLYRHFTNLLVFTILGTLSLWDLFVSSKLIYYRDFIDLKLSCLFLVWEGTTSEAYLFVLQEDKHFMLSKESIMFAFILWS